MLTEKRRKNPPGTDAGHGPDALASRRQRITNWVLALLTIVGAAAAVLFAFGTALGTSGCSDRACPHLGLANAVYGPVVYGAPVVALVTIAVSFVTAKLRPGWMVPAIAWILLIAGPFVLALSLRQ
jgi:uncharacterized RDD family membrane protein YckC